MKIKICITSQINCLLTKFEIFYRNLGDVRQLFGMLVYGSTHKIQDTINNKVLNFQGILFNKKLFILL